jgi:Predicted membrane protein (DUF2154).
MKILNKIFWGLFFLAGAAFIILNQLDVISIEMSVMTIILTVFLTAIIIKSLLHLFWTGVFIPMAVVLLLFEGPLGIGNLAPWPILGAAVLLSISFSIMFSSSKSFFRRVGVFGRSSHSSFESSEHVNTKDNGEVSIDVSFGSAIKYIDSDELKRVSIDCSFGSANVYFDGVKLSKDGADIKVDCSFGAVELFLPKEWKVVNNIDTSFSGIEEKNHPRDVDEKKVVRISGSADFSGITIIYI